MRIEEWWPLLEPDTQNWLISNNGDAIPQPIIDEIRAVEGVATADMSWVGAKIPAGFFLSDAAVDWIEALANQETPKSN